MPTAPKTAMASSEAIDKATCLYETEWQVTEGISLNDRTLLPSVPQQQLLLPQKASLLPTSFMWSSAGTSERPQLVRFAFGQLLLSDKTACPKIDSSNESTSSDSKRNLWLWDEPAGKRRLTSCQARLEAFLVCSIKAGKTGQVWARLRKSQCFKGC